MGYKLTTAYTRGTKYQEDDMSDSKGDFIATITNGSPIEVLAWDGTYKPAEYAEYVSQDEHMVKLAGHLQIVHRDAIREVTK